MDQSSNPLPHDTGDCSLIDFHECLIRVDRLRPWSFSRWTSLCTYFAFISWFAIDATIWDKCTKAN